MREAVGEANIATVTIVLVAIVLTGGMEIVRMAISRVKNNNYHACADIGYIYSPSSDKCVHVGEENPIDVPR